MQNLMGKTGMEHFRRANGVDDSPVIPYREQKSISTEETFQIDTTDLNFLHSQLVRMTESIAFELRQQNRLTGCVTLKLRYSDFETHTAQRSIPYTNADHVLLKTAKDLFTKLYECRLLIRLFGVRFTHLIPGTYQINLFHDTQENIKLYQAIDSVKKQFGEDKVMRGAATRRHQYLYSMATERIEDRFKEIETELDQKLESLSIWEAPFQTIISWLFYGIEDIDRKGRPIAAADYASRISYLYDTVRKKAAVAAATSTPLAITSFNYDKYADDLNFLNAYAHYSMLMPQFHRGTFKVSKTCEKKFQIVFTDADFEKSETLDRLYSYMSIQFAPTYPGTGELRQLLIAKARNLDNHVGNGEAAIIQHMTHFYKQTSLNIRVLTDDKLVNELGFTYDQYLSFCAAVRAYTDFSMEFGRAYETLIAGASQADADTFATEHMEFSVCCLNKVVLEHLRAFSVLSEPVFRNIFEYYLTKYSDTTNDNYKEKGHPGDGYFPPFIWMDDNLLFSSVGAKYLLPFNNLLYSLNKKSVKQFSEKISPHLEPALISQMEYVFSQIPTVQVQKNINYEGGEIDVVVLDPAQKIALCFQVKATVAPDSARTVQRVETRAMEGIDQLARFDSLSTEQKETIINKAFTTNLSGISFQHMLMVRSCAGSSDVWQQNGKYPIINYAVLANLVARKIESKDFTIANFSNMIYQLQEEMLQRSKSVIVNETLKIGDYEIQFPNVDSDIHFILKMHTQTLKQLPDFENIPASE